MDLIRTRFHVFGLILTNMLQRFCKKWIPYESSGQTHTQKLMVYGLSLYDIFIKISDLTCIFPSSLRFFSKTLFFIWSRLRCVYSTHPVCSTHTVCSTQTQCLCGRCPVPGPWSRALVPGPWALVPVYVL